MRLLFIVMVSACTTTTTTPSRTAIVTGPQLSPGNLTAAFGVDLDGDGTSELAVVKDGQLHWGSQSIPVSGSVVADAVGSTDGHSSQTLAIAFGRSRRHPKAGPSLWLLTSAGAEAVELDLLADERITDLDVSVHGVFMTTLDGKKRGRGYTVSARGVEPHTQSIMGTQQSLISASGSVAIGRLYGDTPKSDGDLVLVEGGVTVASLGSLRGVRTLHSEDINGDGSADLIVGDSWHYRYGSDAKATVGLFVGPTFSHRIPVGSIQGSYTIKKLFVLSSTPRGKIVGIGTSSAATFTQTAEGWTTDSLAPTGPNTHATIWSTNPSPEDGKPRHWLILTGDSEATRIIPVD